MYNATTTKLQNREGQLPLNLPVGRILEDVYRSIPCLKDSTGLAQSSHPLYFASNPTSAPSLLPLMPKIA